MKTILTISFVATALSLTIGCNSEKKSKALENAVAETPSMGSAVISQDSIALTKLVRQVYKWYENSANWSDFDPKVNAATDTLYSGIDWVAHNKRVKALAASNYFDKRFIDSYQQIAGYLDTALKSGRELWPVGELPSFGFDASPWCNCQDNPENYWNTIKVTGLKVEKDNADFAWTWGDGFAYKAKAGKSNGAWKISYLEGFAPENFKSNP